MIEPIVNKPDEPVVEKRNVQTMTFRHDYEAMDLSLEEIAVLGDGEVVETIFYG